jgi:hypothetical protein
MTTNMKKYYDNLAKKEVKIITDYKIYKKRKEQLKNKENLIIVYMRNIMKNIFYDLDVVNNITMIDLTYSCGNNSFIINRLKDNYKQISDHFLDKSVFTTFTVSYILNPRYNSNIVKDKPDYNMFFEKINNMSKQDFMFVSGTLEYFMMKSIAYYAEQMSYGLHMLQIYILLKLQAINGSFIFFIYTCDSEVYRKFIMLLQNYYKEIYLFKIMDIHSNVSYIIGKQFLGISDDDLQKLKIIVDDIIKDKELGQNLNVFDNKLRKKHNIVKYLNNNSTNLFIQNLYDFKHNNKYADKQINKFHKKIIYNNKIYD